jgi:hypothetical protein
VHSAQGQRIQVPPFFIPRDDAESAEQFRIQAQVEPAYDWET